MKFVFAFLTSFIIASLLFSTSVYATTQPYFNHLRDDQAVPKACQFLNEDDFYPSHLVYFSMSLLGGTKQGFTYEYPISRKIVTKIWHKYRKGQKPASGILAGASAVKALEVLDAKAKYKAPSQLDQKVIDLNQEKLIVREYKKRGFDLGSEGEILELLGALAVEEELDKQGLFITGSLSYRSGHKTRTIGELDFVVASKKTCQVVAVGEAKLNPKKYHHTREQLNRFKNFIGKLRKGKMFSGFFPKIQF